MKEEQINKICPTCGHKMYKRTSVTGGFQDIVCKNCYMNTEILKGGYMRQGGYIRLDEEAKGK